MVPRHRLVQDRGALSPGPHRLVPRREGAQHPAGPAAAGLRLLVVDAAPGRIEQDGGPPQSLGHVEQPPDNGVPGLVGHLLPPAGELLGPDPSGRVAAQDGIEVGGAGPGPEDLDGDGVLGANDGAQLLARPLVDLGRLDGGPQEPTHPAGVALRAHALARAGARGKLLAQVAAEPGCGPGDVLRRGAQIPLQSAAGRGRALSAPSLLGLLSAAPDERFPGGCLAREPVGLPGDGLRLAARGQDLSARGVLQRPADAVQGAGRGAAAVEQTGPFLLGGAGNRGPQAAAHALEGGGEHVEQGALVTRLENLDGGAQAVEQVRAQHAHRPRGRGPRAGVISAVVSAVCDAARWVCCLWGRVSAAARLGCRSSRRRSCGGAGAIDAAEPPAVPFPRCPGGAERERTFPT